MTVSAPPQQPAAPIVEQALNDLQQSLAQALQLAVNHHQSGRFEDAENLYRNILEAQPNNPDANHNLGFLAVQAKQPSAGLPYFAAALEAQPEQQQYWLSYIDALIQADETETAQQVLELGRQHGLQDGEVEVLARRLEVRARQKKIQQEVLRSGAKKIPGAKKISALMALYNKGRLAEAEVLARSFTTCFPGYGLGWKMLAAVLQLQGRADEALFPAQIAVEILPTDAEAHNNLGIMLEAQGQFTEAKASYLQALKIQPNFAETHSNLGNIFKDFGCMSEAEASYRQALQIQPNLVEVHSNLGNLLKDLGRLSEAEASYRQALEIQPDYADGHSNLGVMFQDQGRFTEAQASYRQALKIRPDFVEAYSNMLFCMSHNEA
ncbi:tetratricopeptide repeat protein, partial [Herminiimonas sp. CN]|uniref:tetratricopeptide repeat protein n=1 Tax=Herminiimonas sp. CN TaxID=1349818 RepID=UPI0004734D5C